MKYLLILILYLFIVNSINAQVPQAFSYKVQIRGNSGNPHANKKINLKISILQDNAEGYAVYIEKHQVNTSPSGIVDIEIGRGIPIQGLFSEIDWKSWPYFVKAELDLKCSGNYNVLAITELLTVPYAMMAGNVTDNNDADADPGNELQALSISNDTVFLSRGGFIVLPVSNKGNYFYGDRDGDGYGDKYEPLWLPEAILPPYGFVTDMNDCNDNNSTVYPGASEICGDGVDQDCNGSDLICIPDTDSDGIPDEADNCPDISNPDQTDTDGDGIGDACQTPDQITDPDGNLYTSVKIGDQEWMVENLKTTKYNDNTPISYPGTDNTAWTNNTSGAYAWYNNDAALYKATYGALYNWHAVNTAKLCPAGWHMPSDPEWTTLVNYLIANGYNYDGSTTGNKIAKALAATTNWATSTTAGSPGYSDYPSYRNKSGFTALPGGYREYNGTFSYIGGTGAWWSATVGTTYSAWGRYVYSHYPNVSRNYGSKHAGFSVRCLRD